MEEASVAFGFERWSMGTTGQALDGKGEVVCGAVTSLQLVMTCDDSRVNVTEGFGLASD
jgi:hypothetical protein